MDIIKGRYSCVLLVGSRIFPCFVLYSTQLFTFLLFHFRYKLIKLNGPFQRALGIQAGADSVEVFNQTLYVVTRQ